MRKSRESRIYAHVRNIGDATANGVLVRFQVSNPLGVGVTGSWAHVGQVTIPTLAAGATTDVFVPWTPVVNLTPQQIASEHFNFHSCIQVIIDSASGEIITSDNQAQENFDSFQAVQRRGRRYPPLHGQFYIHRGDGDGPQTYFLNGQSNLPRGWKYTVANGQQAVTLGPGQTVQVPVDIQVPPGTPIGKSYFLAVQALVRTVMTVDPHAPTPNTQHCVIEIATQAGDTGRERMTKRQ